MTRQSRIIIFLSGNLLVGLGVAGILRARLGAAPFDVTNSGLAGQLGLNVGTASWLVGAVMLLGAWALGRRPRYGTLIEVALVGLIINLTLNVLAAPVTLPARLGLLAAALIFLWVGIICLILSRLGAGPVEELMLAITAHGPEIHTVRWGLEAILLVAGVLLGGQLGIATFILVIGTGPVLAVVLPPLERRLHESLHVEVFPVL